MGIRSNREGRFKLFRTSNDNWIIRLRGDIKGWYAWVSGDRGDLLVLTDGNHEKKTTERKGKYYFAEFQDDPTFNDQPHLFLAKSNGRFDHLVLPQGLPSQGDYQRKVIAVDSDLKKRKVKEHVRGSGVTLPINNYDNRRAEELTKIIGDFSRSQLKQVRDYECSRQQRKTVLDAIERQLAA